MTVSNFQTLIKSCSIEPEMIQVQFMNLLFNRCLCGWMGKVAGILIGGVGVVSSIPSGGNFIFADFETLWCQFLYKNARNANFVLFMKNSSETAHTCRKTNLHFQEIIPFVAIDEWALLCQALAFFSIMDQIHSIRWISWIQLESVNHDCRIVIVFLCLSLTACSFCIYNG